MKPKALILTGYGINCEVETAKCFEIAGGKAEIVHLSDLISGEKKLKDFQIMAFPGGFSYGDDTGAGNAIANKIKNHLQQDIVKFANEDKLLIGICNGFQMITNLGLVPAIDKKYGIRQAALMHNAQARYECRWIYVKNQSQKCVWTKQIEILHLPMAHGEGNFYANDEVMHHLKHNDQIALTYCRENGLPANGKFPENPNGAMLDIAGICDQSGRIFGLMPHPERFNSFTNEYNWHLKKEKLLREALKKGSSTNSNSAQTDLKLPKSGLGLKIFKNAVEYFG
ncbi:phosphoribosylformylglycinamidine synthase I [Candidatus Peregrinibacteria bacterium]|nr:phosphoribosylformylglycinamidine synthase I [Candidatus Peregrinibacteria bacterium]